LSRILSFLGHDVLRLNHVGDWGTQFGMLIHYLKTKFPQQIAASTSSPAGVELKLSVSDLMECYRAAKKCFDEDPLFKEEAKKEVVKLQGGDAASLTVWNAICDKSREEFQKIYDILNIEINERGESFYNPFLAPLVNDLAAKGIIVESQGSKCIFIPGDKYKTPEGEPLPLLLQKSDGVSEILLIVLIVVVAIIIINVIVVFVVEQGFLYATTDMAAVVHRTATEKADRILYVTDAGQAQHFAMVFDAARAHRLVPDSAQLHHVPFGLVLVSILS